MKRKNLTLANIGSLYLSRAKPTSSKKMEMAKGKFHSIRTLKNPSSLLRYSQINGFAMSMQQKVRVRLPKLLVVKNPMQKTEKGPKRNKKKIKWAKPAQLLPKKIGSIFCHGSSSGNDKNDFKADALDECMEDRDALIVSHPPKMGKKGNKFKAMLEDSLEGLTLSKSYSFKKIMTIRGTKGKQMKVNDDENSESSFGTRKQPRILSQNLSGFFKFKFSKRVGFCFTNWKTNKADHGTDFEGIDSCPVNDAEMPKTHGGASIKKPTGYYIIRSVQFLNKKVVKQGRQCKHEDEEEEEEVEMELCKKRILMGEKCRPLSASGSLHYDQDGILLPELLPYQEI